VKPIKPMKMRRVGYRGNNKGSRLQHIVQSIVGQDRVFNPIEITFGAARQVITLMVKIRAYSKRVASKRNQVRRSA
jgi:hypothetical protein